MINIAVLVSGGGTNLQALIDAQGKVLQHGKIKLVISSKPDVYALQRAEKAGLKRTTFSSGAAAITAPTSIPFATYPG